MQNLVIFFFKFTAHLLAKRVFYLLNACIKKFGNRISALLPVGTHSDGQTDRAAPNYKSRQRLKIAILKVFIFIAPSEHFTVVLCSIIIRPMANRVPHVSS